jgi:exonuclease SbcC
MKILKITFQNLNSLKGEHSIDLEKGLLGEAGIFSITGPTGAGKSTILDAITLALFGKAARYEKEANPGEMMTRGTGECSAEVLFECSKGRYSSKWTRARSRKKPDGKLQNPKREVAKAESGEILAEKLKEADLLIESLTGLDYHRFLRSVLLAQGRFKEFLDAGDNERGDLLEKITGTEIYSRISQKAFEIEREHDKGIQTARQRLDGVELQTEEALTALNEEQSAKESEVKILKIQLHGLQTKLQRFDSHRGLSETLSHSNAQLLTWQTADQAFAPARTQLAQHEATQPFQAALIELDSQRRQHSTGAGVITELTQIAQHAQTEAAHQLSATTQQVSTTLQAKAIAIESNEALRLKTEAEARIISTWLTANDADLTIESQLPKIRSVGESVRQADKELKRHQAEHVTLSSDQLKNEQALVEKKASVETAQQALTKAEQLKAKAAEAFTQAAEDKSIDDWRKLAKEQTLADGAAKTLSTQRTHWAKAQAAFAALSEQRPPLIEQLDSAKQTRDAQEATVAKETAILEDKQKIYDQARLIATLEDHRADLTPEQACPLCGSLEHPYAENLESDEDAEKLALQAQKQVLSAADKTQKQALEAFNRLDEKLKALDLNITQATRELDEQAKALMINANASGYTDSITNDDAFTAWQETHQQQRSTTEAKLDTLTKLDSERQTAKDAFSALDAAHQVSNTQLQGFEQKKADLTTKQQANELAQASTQQAIETQLTEFNQQLGDRLSPAQAPLETQSHTQALEQKLRRYKAQIETQAKLQLTLLELVTNLKELRQAQTRLTEELQQWQAELESFVDLPATDSTAERTIAESESQRRSDCQSGLKTAQQSVQTLEQKRKDVALLSLQIQTATKTLQERLSESAFDSIEALAGARLPDDRFAELNEQKNTLKTEHDKLTGRITQTTEELKKLEAEAVITADEAVALKIAHSEQDEQVGLYNKRLGEITLLIEQDSKARASQVEQLKAIQALEKEARPWIELCAMIGSAKGDKFSKFAQGLTLAQLLQLANQHLLQLNDRYVIQRTPESELSLQIIDRYQADAIRPTRSLSGGESFLVSLALALGLSDLAGSDTRIESLFIDEGFGTLDTDTLDTALAALENLRMSNRTIGIISHVDALKQRISAQIRVEKGSNGYGTLQIINGA